MTSLVDEMVGNQKVVQAFGYGKRSLERFDTINEELKNMQYPRHFLFFYHESKHKVCEWACIFGCGNFWRRFGDAGRDHGWTVVLFSHLCQSIYKNHSMRYRVCSQRSRMHLRV